MAKKTYEARTKLFLDTKDATNDAKQFVADLKKKLNEIETAADKMTVFKDLASYIGEIDKSLAALKAKDADVFTHMFDGMDDAFRAEFEKVFKIAKEKVTELNSIRGLLDGATKDTSIEDLKKWQSTIKAIYASMDKEVKFTARKPENMIKEMRIAVDGFATVWQDVMKRMSAGFQFSGTGSGEGTGSVGAFSDEVQQEINKLEQQIKHLESLK